MRIATLSIRRKIGLSFAILAVLLIVVGVIAYNNLQSNKNELSSLVKDVQPAVVLSLKIVDQLDRSDAALGFYLLSKEAIHKKDYLENMQRINESVNELKTMNVVTTDPVTVKLVAEVEKGIKKLQGYKSTMLTYATDDVKNIPATDFASREVNPRVLVLLQNLQEMIMSETSQPGSAERKQILADIYSLRTNLASAVNELRLYLAFRRPNVIDNFKNYVDLVEKDVKKLNSYGEDKLSFEQVAALETFNKVYKEYFPLADRLIKIHGAEDWRKDAYVIRKEIAPLVLTIQSRLTELVTTQSNNSVRTSDTLTDKVDKTTQIVAGLIGLGLFASILVGFLLSRTITRPIDKLKSNAHELSHGNLDQPIDTKRRDELGDLARSFADMRDSIKKKLEDLRVLNIAGEIMAGMHEPIKVLERALMVMRGKTDIEWGSVFLYNESTELLEVKVFHPTRFGEDPVKARAFKLGEGIAGKAAAEKRVIYIPDTSQDTQFTPSAGSKREARSVICVPMIDNNKVFGVMNFSGKVGIVKFTDDDVEFAETIARTAVVSFKNINMLNVIEEQNRTLEQKVEARTAELRQKTNDINNMLQNMHQGIFTVLPGSRIHPEYSAYLETILETKQIANADFMQLMFSQTSLGSNAIDQVRAAMNAILGEDAMMFDFNKHCLIKEYPKVMPNGREKILELDWDPIQGDNGTVDKLMVTVRDVTELRALQLEAEKQKWELEIIGQLLAISASKVVAFTRDANRLLDENEAMIKDTATPTADQIATLFRNMHTIKGNARTYNFTGITDAAHEAEATYDKIRKNLATPFDSSALLAELYHVRELVQTYEMIYREKLSGSDANGTYVDTVLLQKLKDIVNSMSGAKPEQLANELYKLNLITEAFNTETLPSVLEAIVKSMPDLAKKLDKATPKVVIHDNNIRFKADVVPVIKNVFTHGFRNAIDHGLETRAERLAHGKSEQGTITVDVAEDHGNIIIHFYDDGRGLAISKIKQKAVQAGVIGNHDRLTDEQLAELVFMSGLSTADNVSDISGRGVGMDAIRKFIENLGGKVTIRFTNTAGNSDEYRSFESCITLPANCSVKVA